MGSGKDEVFESGDLEQPAAEKTCAIPAPAIPRPLQSESYEGHVPGNYSPGAWPSQPVGPVMLTASTLLYSIDHEALSC